MSEQKEALLPNYMDRPHRYTAGPAGRCLFCSHTQTHHATNRPRTPSEIAQEKLAQKLQDQAQDKYDQNLMLTAVPTEEDLVNEAGKKMAVEDKAAKIAGNTLHDENDPMAAAGLGGYEPPAEMMADAGVAKAQGFGGPGDADSGDAPLPNSVGAAIARKTTPKTKKPKPAPASPTPPAKASAPDPKDPNAPHAKTLPKEGPDPGGDPDYKPPLSDEPRHGLSDAQRQAHADSGEAMKDGTMPIRDDPEHSESDLNAAQKVWGKHRDPAAARDHVVDRAEKLKLIDRLHPTLREHAERRKQRQPVGKMRYSITKTTDEQRFSFGPLYMPSQLDAHGEYVDSAVLQKALWSYMGKTDRKINLQHQRGVTAGTLVEAVSWPSSYTTTLTVPGQVEKAAPTTFPAGTCYIGVQWEPWAWNLIKNGNLRGLSMGGSANRVQADLDIPEEVEKRFFSAGKRKKAASAGAALPDGSFPIYNTKDLANARALAGKAKNPSAARRHIARRAIALGVAKALIELKQRVPPPVAKYRTDQPRVPSGQLGAGRWFGIGPEVVETPESDPTSEKLTHLIAADIRQRRQGPSSHAGVYVGKSYALT